jgi:hypothetical protein
MERLLLLRLRSTGCRVEVRVNDIPVARTTATPAHLSMPVHEFLFEGTNELALVVEPPNAQGLVPPPRLAPAACGASLRLLLPRVGQAGSEHNARALGELDWALAEGELINPPLRLARQIELPVKFPRWRWVDVPVLPEPAEAQPIVAAFVQQLAISLARGDADTFLQAARLRFEDLALAYQRPLPELADRWRARIQMLHATKALKVVIPALPEVLLRPCAGGRLLECVGADGEPVLRTEAAADGTRQAWPIRVAVIDGRCHVMR